MNIKDNLKKKIGAGFLLIFLVLISAAIINYNNYFTANLFLGIGCFLTFIIISLSFYFINKDIDTREDTEEKLHKSNRLISLLQNIASASNEAQTFHQVLKYTLERICNYTSLPIGHVYLCEKENEILIPSELWHSDKDLNIDEFKEVTSRFNFRKGEGLPGRVLETGKPIWIEDISQDSNFPRMKNLKIFNLKSGLAFPVHVNGIIVAVLEFYSDKIIPPDNDLISVLINISTQISRVFERKHNEEKMHKGNKMISMLENIAVVANQSDDVNKALTYCLERICNYTGWPVGHIFWLNDERTTLESSGLFYFTDEEKFKKFKEVSLKTKIEKGKGLVGKVLETMKPFWIDNINEYEDFPRAKMNSELNIKSGFAFPIIVGKEVVGVIEFFSETEFKKDTDLLNLMVNVGNQIGRVVERKRAVEAFRASEERFRAVIESASDAIVSSSIAHSDKPVQCIIVGWNKGAEKMFGYKQEEALGDNLEIIIPEKYIEGHRRGIERLIQTGKANIIGKSVEIEAKRKDGSIFPIELSLSLWNVNNRLFSSAIIRDITERFQSQQEIQILNDELEKRVRERTAELEAINKELEAFSYTVSHDLRAPLRAIDGFVHVLLEETKDKLDDEAKRTLNIISQNAKTMRMLIDDLLSFSRLSRKDFDKSIINIHALIYSVLGELIPENSRVKINVNESFPETFANFAMLKQVYINLISNSLKFTRNTENPFIEIGGYTKDNENVYYIKDNGVGFEMQYASKLFGIFQRLHSSDDFEGTGVGLAIVKRIIDKHGGRIWAHSKEGEGASFYFTLPIKN